MKIVNVYKTDVLDQATAKKIVRFLKVHFADFRINFDLDDCDKILRIESRHATIVDIEIQNLIAKWGYVCHPLSD